MIQNSSLFSLVLLSVVSLRAYSSPLEKLRSRKQTIYFEQDNNVKVELLPYQNAPDLLEETKEKTYRPVMFLRKVNVCKRESLSDKWICPQDGLDRYFDFSLVFSEIVKNQKIKGNSLAVGAGVGVVALALLGGWVVAAGVQAAILTYTGTATAVTLSSSTAVVEGALVMGAGIYGEYTGRQLGNSIKHYSFENFKSVNPWTYYSMSDAFTSLSGNQDASSFILKNVDPKSFISKIDKRIHKDIYQTQNYARISEIGFDEIWIQKRYLDIAINEISSGFEINNFNILGSGEGFFIFSCTDDSELSDTNDCH